MRQEHAEPLNLPKALDEQDHAILAGLHARVPVLRERWDRATPFRYLVIDDFLPSAIAGAMHACYPTPELEAWDKKTYAHQKKKFTMRSGFPGPIDDFFRLSATHEFKAWLSEVTGVEGLLDDPELIGGGLHKIVRGGFLDVHVDYNFHPKTKLHRRLNVLLYLNPDWQREYEGYLELWDMTARQRIENIAPVYNRVVIFETNEVSFHGHPVPLETPPGVARNSLALYYYTKERDDVATEHNTLYRHTSGARGRVKTLVASAQAARERLRERGVAALTAHLAKKALRIVRGLPPENQ